MADARPDHHGGNGFRHPPGRPRSRAGFVDMARFLWRRMVVAERMPEVPVGHVVPEAEALAMLAALEGRDSLTWLGHACFLIRAGGTTILTDPYLTDHASPTTWMGPRRFVPPGISIAKLPPIDVIVLSHNHYDHLDTRTLDRLPGRERIAVVVPLGLGGYFHSRGFGAVHEVDWHQGVSFDEVTVTALPAIHFSRRGPFDRNKTLWMSAAIDWPGQRLYFSGDTAMGPVFSDIGARYGPFSAALVGIAAYLPQVIMKASHTTPEEAVELGRDIGAERLVAMHWGTVVLTDEPPFEPPERFRRAAAEAGYDAERAWIMRIGESWPLQTN